MSDATGVGGVRGSSRGASDELPAWPDDAEGLSLGEEPEASRASGPSTGAGGSAASADDVEAMSAAAVDDIQSLSAAPIDDIQGMSYEQARDALVAVVDRLERGGTTLEESLALWERGEALAARCEAWLTGARARLEAARAGAQARSTR